MVTDYTFRKYKDRYWLKNLSTNIPLSYTLYKKSSCENDYEIVQSIFLIPVNTEVEVDFSKYGDGDYRLEVLRSGEIVSIDAKYYLRLQKELIHNILAALCGNTNNCRDCDQDSTLFREQQAMFNQLLAYQFLIKPETTEYCQGSCLFDKFLYQALQLNSCSLQGLIYQNIFEGLLTGQAEISLSKEISMIFASIYYSMYYYFEDLVADDADEKAYVTEKFNFNVAKICIRKHLNCFNELKTLFQNVASGCNEAPTVNSIIKYFADIEYQEDELIYQFVALDFTTNYSDPNGDAANVVKLFSPPFRGKLYYDGIQVTADNFTFNIEDVGKLQYKFTIEETNPNFDKLFFQINDVNPSPKYSNMATITISVSEYINKPPSEVGDNSFTISNRAVKIFTVADFTTNTTPPYADPEGDAMDALRIDSLPADGALKLNGTPCTVGQIITSSQISSGLFTYTAPNQNAADSDNWNFSLRDTGSMQFSS